MEFLIEQLKGKSRTTIKALLAHRQVSVGTHTITQFDYPLEPNQLVTINWGVVPEQTRLRGVRILFEDPYLIVIDKEAGMLSIATAKEKLADCCRLKIPLPERFWFAGSCDFQL